jgi:acylpyruvate hydrolase
MRLASVLHQGAPHAARLAEGGQSAVLLTSPDVGALLADPDGLATAANADGAEVGIEDLTFRALTRPSKVVCVGLNYRGHVEETGRELPSFPTLFGKFNDSLCGAYDDIPLPTASDKVDWETELTVVIGRDARAVDESSALEHVAGYTVANDTSMRDWQNRTLQWLQGKNFEASTPIGPVLVTPEEIDHAADLRISCTINDEVVQDSRTSDLIFPPAHLVAYVSTFTTLRPGDLILTGTPAGVGHARNPPRFIGADDVVVVSVEGIGECRNRFVKAAS